MRDIERFKTLEIDLRRPAQIENALRTVTDSALLLEEIFFISSRLSPVPLGFFEGKAPLLRRLTLLGCKALSQSILLRHITHLSLHLSHEKYTLAELTELLTSMPDLQVLKLFVALAEETVICRPISFKSLRSLALMEVPQSCASLLRVVRPPPSCHADVYPGMKSSEPFTDAHLCDITAMIAANHDGYTFLDASSAYGARLGLMTITAGVHAVKSKPWSLKDHRLTLHIPKTTDAGPENNKIYSPMRAMVASLKKLNLYALSYLTMNMATKQVDSMTLCDWLDIFLPMRQLHELRLSAPDLERVLGALYEGTAGAEAMDVHMRLPRLRHLHLALATADHTDQDASYSDSIIAVLSDCLVARQDAYTVIDRLEHLVLGHGLLGRNGNLQLLKEMVPDVTNTAQRRFV